MTVLQVTLRIIAALIEMNTVLLEKATPEQVQAIIERHEQRIAPFVALLNKVMPSNVQAEGSK